MIDAAETIWVCEKGHVDDHHLGQPNPEDLCSRCGGICEQFSLDGLAREYRERLRVNVGILAENRQLKGKLGEANLRSVAEVLAAVAHHLHTAGEARDIQAALDRVDAALKLLAPFRDQQEEAPR